MPSLRPGGFRGNRGGVQSSEAPPACSELQGCRPLRRRAVRCFAVKPAAASPHHLDMSVRTLVADDEPLARSGIVRLVRGTPGFEVAGEARDGPEAVSALRSLRPDMVLLDVQLPGCDGFEVIRAVGPEQMPPVVFVTAWDQYAVRAFELQAIDFVLKPFDDARLQAALGRAAHLASSADLARRLRALIAAPETPPALGGLAREMLVRLAPEPELSPARPPWLQRVLEVVHARSGETLSLGELAQVAGVHPVYLARAFRAHLGTTLGAYLRKLRVDRAAEQLTATELSIAEIALDAGFADQSHLTRVFRAAVGATPAQYRERFRRP